MIHLYWSGTQWILHQDLDPAPHYDHLLAYSKTKANDPSMTSTNWFVKVGKKFELSPKLGIFKSVEGLDHHDDEDLAVAKGAIPLRIMDILLSEEEVFGVPGKLLPFYMAFMLDAIAVGLVMPLLPFTVMELGANAMQLSLVVSSNYIAQSIGCLIMGRVSDAYGRKVVMSMCLMASSLSYFFLAQAQSLTGFALARIISGSFGGLIPVMQSTVADTSPQPDRPKYLGRIMATFGLGFVIGPALSAVLHTWTTRQKIRLASFLPFCGFLLTMLVAQETKRNVRSFAFGSTATGSSSGNIALNGHSGALLGSSKKRPVSRATSPVKAVPKESNTPTRPEVIFLVINGFAIMYAFATETIYAMFIKDSFGYGESILSTVFAMNGLFIGLFQIFLIKPLIGLIGKHATLALGNFMLALGMVGVALVREQTWHFSLFAAHIVGYSIADTTLASLISKYSSPATQGRDLALNQAAQACARVISPLCAGVLYEYSKRPNSILPVGALPFLAGAVCPAVAIAVPSFLYWQNRRLKLQQTSSNPSSSLLQHDFESAMRDAEEKRQGEGGNKQASATTNSTNKGSREFS